MINERYGYQPRLNQMALAYHQLHPTEGRLYYSNNSPDLFILFVSEKQEEKSY